MDELVISNPINVKDFLNECRCYLSDYDLGLTNEYVTENFVEYPKDFDRSRFNADDLRPRSGYTKEFLEKIKDTKGLKVLEERKAELEKPSKKDRSQSDGPWTHLLFNQENPVSTLKESEKIQLPDILIKVHFYKACRMKKPHVRDQEFDILGQTTLSSLKEKLYCPSDHVAIGNCAANPDAPVETIAKDVYKSSFFFIEGSFYNDMSHPESIDLSEVIKEWADERKDRVGPFKYYFLEGVKMIDLTIRLGQPYLYVHQGDCEHLIIFSDIRMVTEDDCQQTSKYPIATFRNSDRRSTCRSCGAHAKWITFDSSLTPEDPCFFCDLCLKMFFYDSNGTLLEPDLRVYHSPDYQIRPDNENKDDDDDDDTTGSSDDDDDGFDGDTTEDSE